MEGGREVGPILTRYVSRALRSWAAQHPDNAEQVRVLPQLLRQTQLSSSALHHSAESIFIWQTF